MKARIFQPAKTAMQSGRANTRRWVVEFDLDQPKSHDPLMGWTSSGDTAQQVRLTFATKEDAVAHCQRQGIAYDIAEPNARVIKPKAYASNFRWDRVS